MHPVRSARKPVTGAKRGKICNRCHAWGNMRVKTRIKSRQVMQNARGKNGREAIFFNYVSTFRLANHLEKLVQGLLKV